MHWRILNRLIFFIIRCLGGWLLPKHSWLERTPFNLFLEPLLLLPSQLAFHSLMLSIQPLVRCCLSRRLLPG